MNKPFSIRSHLQPLYHFKLDATFALFVWVFQYVATIKGPTWVEYRISIQQNDRLALGMIEAFILFVYSFRGGLCHLVPEMNIYLASYSPSVYEIFTY